MELFRLFGTINLEDNASKGLDGVDEKAEKTGGKFGKLAKGVAIGAAAVGAAAVGAGVGIFALASKVGDSADEILDLNAITGMSTDEIQKWRKATEVAGVGVNAMTNASAKLTRNLDMMSTGTGKGAESLDKLGISFDELENMSADEQMSVMTDALAGVEDETERARLGTDLFGGSWKEIAPVVSMGADAMQDAKDSANIISKDELDKANEFRIKVADMKDQLGFFATQIAVAVMPMLNGMMDWVSGKMPLFKSIMETALNGVKFAAEAVSDFFTGTLLPAFQTFMDWLEPKLPAIKEGFELAFGFIKTVLEEVGGAIQDLTGWFVKHWGIIGPILAGVAAGAVAFKVITAAMAAYRAIMALVTAVQVGFNLAMLANPIGIIVVAIGLLVAAGILLYKNWDLVKEKLGLFWEKIKEVWESIVNTIKDAIERLKEDVTNGFNAVKEFFTNLWEGIKTFFSVIWEGIKQIFSTVVSAIVEFVRQRFENLKNNVSAVFNAVRDFISNVWNGIKSFFTTVITAIVEFIKQRFENLKNNVTNVFNGVKSFITNTWNAIKSSVSNIVESIKNAVRDKFEALKSAVRDKMNGAKDTIKGIWDDVMGFFKGIDLFSMGKDIIQGLINGIKNMGSTLWSAVTSLVKDNIPGPIAKILKIASPSKVMHQYGEWTGEGLEDGMEDSTTGINRAAQGMARAAIPSFNQMEVGASSARSLLPSSKAASAANSYDYSTGDIHITIPARDIKEFSDVTEFFKRLPQTVNQY